MSVTRDRGGIAAALFREWRIFWPAWLAASYILLMPFSRSSHAPIVLLALMAPVLVVRHRHRLSRQSWWALLALFACFWIPQLISSVGSLDPDKSWRTSLAAIRLLGAAVSLALLMHSPDLRRRLLQIVSAILLFWAVDGYVQLAFGVDLLGIPTHPDRLNALWGERHQYYGVMLAMLSPLLIEHVRQRHSRFLWLGALLLIFGAVLIAGMRAGWLTIALIALVYQWLLLRHRGRHVRLLRWLLPLASVLLLVFAWMASPLVQERLNQSLVTDLDNSSVNRSLSARLPIWEAAITMWQENPVNGVGVRAFSEGYLAVSPALDAGPSTRLVPERANHAHNVVLEIMADTGSVGLAGAILALIIAWRQWRRLTPEAHRQARPFLFALLLILFPLNSHFAILGSTLSTTIWWLIGLWAACWDIRESDSR